MIFYHITTPEHWAQFDGKDFYEAASLHSEGFIHGSFAAQLDETLKVHYRDVPEVLLVKIDAEKLTSKLVVEKSRNGEDFPHVYGAINKTAIVEITPRKLI